MLKQKSVAGPKTDKVQQRMTVDNIEEDLTSRSVKRVGANFFSRSQTRANLKKPTLKQKSKSKSKTGSVRPETLEHKIMGRLMESCLPSSSKDGIIGFKSTTQLG